MDQKTPDTSNYLPAHADLVSELASRQRYQRELALDQAVRVCLHRGDNLTEKVIQTAGAFYAFISTTEQPATPAE